jgi:MFS family permease
LFFGPILPVAVAALAPPGERGAYQGAWGMVFGLGVGGALWLASLLERQMGWARTWLLFAAIFALVAGALLLARAHFRRIADERAAASFEVGRA